VLYAGHIAEMMTQQEALKANLDAMTSERDQLSSSQDALRHEHAVQLADLETHLQRLNKFSKVSVIAFSKCVFFCLHYILGDKMVDRLDMFTCIMVMIW